MKIIAIGDIHGKNVWEKIVEKEKDADLIIFVGDYFDGNPSDFTTEYHNFIKILDYKEANKDKVILLFGNHDIHYHNEFLNINESYGRFQKKNYLEIAKIINDNLDKFQMCYLHKFELEKNPIIFTHAGVTKTWLTSTLEEEQTIENISIPEHLDNLFKNDIQKFCFYGFDPYGDDIIQSPVWVRPKSLYLDYVEGYDYVVGHTRFKQIQPILSKDNKTVFTFIDVLDTNDEYLIINDGILEAGLLEE